MDETLDQIEQELRAEVFQANLRQLVINQVEIVKRLQDKALNFDTPPADIHTNIASASTALADLMAANGESMVLVEVDEDGEAVG